jgi:hypothetical protein
MAQFGRPDSDLNLSNWKDEGDGTTNIYASIDEATASDADYIKSGTAPSSEPYVCGLSNVEDPQSSSGHVVRYRYQKDSAGGAQIDLTVQLRQGYVNEGTPGTLIKEDVNANISNGWADDSMTLSAGEADSITDYTDLQLRFVANQV